MSQYATALQRLDHIKRLIVAWMNSDVKQIETKSGAESSLSSDDEVIEELPAVEAANEAPITGLAEAFDLLKENGMEFTDA